MADGIVQIRTSSDWWKSNPEVAPENSAHVMHEMNLLPDELGDFIRFLNIFKSVSVCIPHRPNEIDFSFVSKISNLYQFRMLMYKFDDYSQFSCLPPTLRSFQLGDTHSKRLSLSFLERFDDLKELRIEKHRKDIECIRSLAKLKDIELRSITLPDLEFIGELKNIESIKKTRALAS